MKVRTLGFHVLSKNRGVSPQIIHFNRRFPYKSSILIGFSLIFTIHLGGFPPIFGSTPIYLRVQKSLKLLKLKRVELQRSVVKFVPLGSREF